MKRVLIIEDELSIAELERDYFEINGLAVDIEERGDRGSERARSGGYDLIVVDLMLPGADGFEVCRQIRAELDIPILMVSAKKEDIDKIRALGLGADDYITKPFSPGELVARVKAHLDRYQRLTGARERRPELRIRGLLVEPLSHRVYINGREVSLTVKEYELLSLLASNPDRLFPKEELFERVWGLDSLGDLATLTVHIRKIREKIEADPSNPQYIETVWGVGYRFRA
ncbi:DNA-binding response OmpR family regulator [Hydrogenispora ethanolica]|uniref:DNA-binding response OmpR family regulator n=1 Tax=Hydrogenispora ethanolica TaxID=1082276 RepID=A0A4R1R9N0_HYDET|nr:response regulator transcription factor [Hydrogenispora ethanolica]TCL62299.1 DNA-binding response OmpR family regulator [Hydrogenispora ethanolica]